MLTGAWFVNARVHDIHFTMTLPSGLRSTFVPSKCCSSHFSCSGANTSSKTKTSGTHGTRLADVQYQFIQQETADTALIFQKQHRFRPPLGIQHWFDAFDDCLFDSDSDEESGCHDVEKSYGCRNEGLTMKKQLLIRTDFGKVDACPCSPPTSHPQRLIPNSKPRMQAGFPPSAEFHISYNNGLASKGQTVSSPLFQADPAHLTSYFDISSSSLPRLSPGQPADCVSDRPLSISWFQGENEDEIVGFDKANNTPDNEALPSEPFELHKLATQHQIEDSSNLDIASETSSYSLTDCVTVREESLQALHLLPISPLDCRFSCLLSQIELNTESILLTRRRRYLRPLNLSCDTTIAK